MLHYFTNENRWTSDYQANDNYMIGFILHSMVLRFHIQSPLSKGHNVQILSYLDEANLDPAQFVRSLKTGKKIRGGGLESPSGAAVKVAVKCRRSRFVYLSLFSCHRHKGTASAAKVTVRNRVKQKERSVFLNPILSLSPDHSQLSFLIALSHIANTVTAFNKVFSLQNLYFVTWWFQVLWRIIIIESKKQRNWLLQYIKCVKCIRRVFVFQWCPSRVRCIVLFFCTRQWRDSICFFWA